MQRNQNPGQHPRRNAERDAAQPLDGQPRTDDEDDTLQEPDQVPSFLTARELQAREPGKGEARSESSLDDDDDESGEDSGKPPKQAGKQTKKGGKSR